MGKRVERNKELWIAIGINLLFILVYVCLCHPYYETSDDNGMAYFLEGAYGTRTAHLVFENIIWGKFLLLLSVLLPGIKWYTVAHYTVMFCAYVGISYFLMRVGEIRKGFVGSVFILLVFGTQSYILFQWSRAAAVTTIGGMILLFYGVEYARSKREKVVTLAIGVILCILGSMIRFQLFAVCVVLSGGVVLMKLAEITRKRAGDWKKKIGTYFLVFGTVGIASITFYGMDRIYYMRDETWSDYLEYNKLRAELWDLGFPDYTKNIELYEKMGISWNDMEMYRSWWNMDEELLPVETLRDLVEAKEEKKVSLEWFKEFIKTFWQFFLGILLFDVFLVVSIISIGVNKKNLFIVFYELIAIMAFCLYFYWIGRFGLNRINVGMLAAGIVAILCRMAEDMKGVTIDRRWMVVLSCSFVLLYMPSISGRIFSDSSNNTSSYELTEMLSGDKENLYLVSPQSKVYNMFQYGYDFWEPAQVGSLSNIWYMGGWEFNVPVRRAMIAKYGIANIYRDSIDNSNVCLIANEETEIIERYIQENYNQNVSMRLLKHIGPFKIWGVRSGEIQLERKVNRDLTDIVHQIELNIKGSKIIVSGYAYKKETNSFQQRAYLKLRNLKSGEIMYKELTMSQLENCMDLMNGKYSAITGEFNIGKGNQYGICIVLEADDELYEIPFSE